MKFLIFLCLVGGGTGLVIYAFPIVRLIGHIDWAEKHLGPGGSYTFLKIAGILAIIIGFYYLVKF